MTTREFDSKLNEFLESDNEAGARAFIHEHYIDLPKERQDSLSWAFLEEAAEYAAQEAEVLSTMQEGLLAAIDE